MKSEDGMLFPLLLFNYSLLTRYLLLSKNKKGLLLLFNYSLLTQHLLLSKETKIKKGNLPRLPIFINLKSNTMKNTVQR